MRSGTSRRAFLIAPFALGGWWLVFRRPARALPDPAAEGNGPSISLTVYPSGGGKPVRRTLKKIVKTNAEWRAELAPEIYQVTRCAGTEFAFANRFWDEHRAGLYRCTCCAMALFRSEQKFDSGTGWPSFTAPIAPENLAEREDRTIAEIRTAVLCSRCDAHLGHAFRDGPTPLGLRYCVNSAALAFIEDETKS
jgi:peptide-methionine (R)-S-oxide reductase